MPVRTGVSRYFSLRRILIQIHLDLFKVESHISYDRWPEPLTDFEILVLILEDRRFFKHHGIDVRSIEREIFRALTLRRFGGPARLTCNWSARLLVIDSERWAGNCMRCFSHASFNIGTTNLKSCAPILPAPSTARISLAAKPPL
jgi:hypothetical protein